MHTVGGQPTFGQRGADWIPPQGAAASPHPSYGPVLHTPPAPGHAATGLSAAGGGGVPQVPQHDPFAVSLRNQVIDRMLTMSRNHAAHAWTNRRSQPVCPHAIAFLYADAMPMGSAGMAHDDGVRFATVVAATRMVNDSDDVQDLTRLLYRLTNLARGRYLPTAGGFDPAVQMATHRDRSSGHAYYIGLGVSTLDTPKSMWAAVQRTGSDVEDVAGRCFVLLADDTALLIDRGAPRLGRHDVGVHATRDLNYAGGVPPRAWTEYLDVTGMPAHIDVWNVMDDLHQLTLRQTRRPTL